MPPAVSSAARRAKRVIDSASENESSPLDDIDVEEDELESEEDAPGSDDDFSAAATPEASNVKIKLRVAPGGSGAGSSAGRSKRAAAVAATAANAASAAKEAKETNKRKRKDSEEPEVEVAAEAEEEDELEEEEDDTASPSKMTARQRARTNKDLQETLIALPDGQPKLKPILTEAERLQKREEMARRRKRQNEQRLQDEQDQTINRLLRAQTGRSRSKLDNVSPMPDTESARESGMSSPTKRAPADGIHFESRMDGDKLVLALAVPPGREEWIAIGEGEAESGQQPVSKAASCAVPGCDAPRKYRCVAKFEVGGCSLAHLKQVEKTLV